MRCFLLHLAGACLAGLVALSSQAQSPPFAFTQAAGPVASDAATLTGMVVPNGLPTVVWFEWGTNADLDHLTPGQDVGAATRVVTVRAQIALPGSAVAVRFRLVASNEFGLVRSAVNRFTSWGVPVGWGATNAGQLGIPMGLGRLVSMESGNVHTLALMLDGTVAAWGTGLYGETNIPAGLSNVIAVAGGLRVSAALVGNGSFTSWGTYLPQTPPRTNLVAIAAGASIAVVGLTADGLVRTWGESFGGGVPAGLSNVVAIAMGSGFGLALKATGSLAAWGPDNYGVVRGATNFSGVVAIAAGQNHGLALRTNGTVVAWGRNDAGQTNVPVDLTNVVAIAAGAAHSLALTESGEVIVWGSNAAGQTNVPPNLSGVMAICAAAGGSNCFALRQVTANDQRVEVATQTAGPVTADSATLTGMVVPNGSPTAAWFEWGTNGLFSQASPPVPVGASFGGVHLTLPLSNLPPHSTWQFRTVASNTPGTVAGAVSLFLTGGKVAAWGPVGTSQVEAPAAADFVAVSAGSSNSFALRTDGTVVGWGTNLSGALTMPANLSNVVALSTRRTGTLALLNNGQIVPWGTAPTPPVSLPNAIAVACGDGYALALTVEGRVVAWGYNFSGRTNVPVWLANAAAVAAGGAHSLALTAGGRVVAWGDNASGQSSVPASLAGVIAIAAGASHSLALRGDGTVVAWGSNASGQTIVPAGLSNVVAIAAGDNHSLAVKADGSVIAWGSNSGQQLTVPAWLSSAVAAAGGTAHSLALRSLTDDDFRPHVFTQPTWTAGPNAAILNGSVALRGLPTTVWFEWGNDTSFGQVTSSTNVDGSAGLARVSMAISGLLPHTDYVCRIVASNAAGFMQGRPQWSTTGRRVAAWGYDYYGETAPPRGCDNVVALGAGYHHGLGVVADGSVVTWGKYYQAASPQPPANLAGVAAVAGGLYHSIALRTNGTVVAWGTNLWPWADVIGVPASLSHVVAIAAGEDHCLGLKADGTVVAWGYSTSGATRIPSNLSNVVAIASSDRHCAALRIDGTVVAWGDTLPAPPSLGAAMGIATGWGYSYALRTNGNVVGWYGCDVPTNLTNVAAVSAGMRESMALLEGRSIVVWNSRIAWVPPFPLPPPMSNVIAIASASAGEFHLALGPNTPPQASSLSVTGAVNLDQVIPLPARDANNDPLTWRLTTLPLLGALYQYTGTGRGAEIVTPGALVSDPQGRVVFAAQPDASGIPYTSFEFAVNDGEYDSLPAVVTVNLVPQPVVLWSSASGMGTIALNFAGLTNASYRVWTSTNLTTWTALGAAGQSSPGWFQFTDTSAAQPQRFYRISCP
jgi:alpha-tubulin suppressor-like RCC1 family protein